MTKNIVKFYQKNIMQYKDSVGSLGWGSVESQQTRFKILTKYIDFTKANLILDVGCGLGDYLSYLKRESIHTNYIGIDIVPEMIEQANKNHLDATFILGDIRTLDQIAVAPEYVVASGTFNYLTEDHEKYLWDSIIRMFDIAKVGVVFNIMSTNAPQKYEDNYYANPSVIIEHSLKLSSNIILDHSYMEHDFTIRILK